MRSGCIKWFNNRKGYGFVYDVEDGREYFFHYTDIVSDQEFKKFYENEHVTFDIHEGNKGLCAYNVTKFKKKQMRPVNIEDIVQSYNQTYNVPHIAVIKKGKQSSKEKSEK